MFANQLRRGYSDLRLKSFVSLLDRNAGSFFEFFRSPLLVAPQNGQQAKIEFDARRCDTAWVKLRIGACRG